MTGARLGAGPTAAPPIIPFTARAALDSGLLLTARACAVGLVLTPLVINPTAYDDSFMGPKWAWIAMMAVAGFAAALGRAAFGRPLRFPFHALWIAPFVFFALNLLSAAWAPSRSLALERAAQVGSLTLALWLLNVFAPTRRWMIRHAWLWVAVACVTALWTIKQDFVAAWWPERAGMRPNLPDWRGYLAAGLGNTNHIGDLLALALIVALVFLGTARRRLPLSAALAGSTLLAAALTVSYSVGSNLGLVAGAAAMLAVTFVRERLRFFRNWRRWAILAALWAAMLAFYNTDHALNPHRPGILKQGFSSERWREGGPTRVVIWAGALEIIRERPWFGAGAGNFTYLFPATRSELVAQDPELRKYLGAWTNAGHNEILQTWSELGAPGLFVFLALIALAYQSLLSGIRWRPRLEYLQRMALVGLLTAWLAQSMMNFTLQTPVGALSLIFILWGAWVESRVRAGLSRDVPLVTDYGPCRVTIEVREMSRFKSVGVALRPGLPGAEIVAVIPLALALALAVPALHRPARAQTEYARARRADNPEAVERRLKYALELDPRATGVRSFYSDWLIRNGEPKEGLDQLKEVRKRLDSTELFEREARAWAQLNEPKKAAKAMAEYRQRHGAPPE